MNRSTLKTVSSLGLLAMSTVLLSACGGDNHHGAAMSTVSYDITVTNLSHSQPLSPVGVLLHRDGYTPWSIGAPASAGLEVLAEGGDNSRFIADDAAEIEMTASGTGLVMPGASETISIETEVNEGDEASLSLSLATMLVNTNDAFSGVSALSLSSLNLGDETMRSLATYDAGTEANNELLGTIPGPADGGEGFNVARDDVNFVARHPGIVGQDEGYADSVLSSAHKFDSPVLRLTVKRTQ